LPSEAYVLIALAALSVAFGLFVFWWLGRDSYMKGGS
jgi:nitrogen fixation-related uncharacterized protein